MKPMTKLATVPAALALILGTGILAGGASLVAAQSTSTTTAASQGATLQRPDHPRGPHQANGITEQILTGDAAAKVTQAALTANPGATIERVETDADADAYEAHIVKSDGSRATVKFDSSFAITKTEAGPNFAPPQGNQQQNAAVQQ
jgi:hypothetical protein